MRRSYYEGSISQFVSMPEASIIGDLVMNNEYPTEPSQRDAWLYQIRFLKKVLKGREGYLFFEYAIPRMGLRIDVVIVERHIIFVIEFKVGQTEFLQADGDQAWAYGLDLKNFHETSHAHYVAPILLATDATRPDHLIPFQIAPDKLFSPIQTSSEHFETVYESILAFAEGNAIDVDTWGKGSYSPTPTIIEAATALYNQHSVENISRKDASARNLKVTGDAVSKIIADTRQKGEKAICFVTGVPGAGKTLVGLDVATKYLDAAGTDRSVFLSGNGPLVAILTEALARDAILRAKKKKKALKKSKAREDVKVFIQNVHHYRDEYLKDPKPPIDHIAIFDEAQRAWDREKTADFMKRRKKVFGFSMSEPEFLISCLDRHNDWAAIVCLVGGGQEINRGEAGIKEWIAAIERSFPDWKMFISAQLTDSEYDAVQALEAVTHKQNLIFNDDLHLSVSMRSFRAERVATFVKKVLDLEVDGAKRELNAFRKKYPVALTRDLATAKAWLRTKARGDERYGIVVSSNAQRLKPLAIDIKSPMNPVNWFLEGKMDVRSSYYLEDVATEFHVQGLEVDWACVTWDADFRFTGKGWSTHSFVGDRWHQIKKAERKQYLKNAYRVLLTRARQGMIIVVPPGDADDHTRKAEYYDATFEYLKGLEIEVI